MTHFSLYRLLPSIDRIRAYRELCDEATYVMRVKSEIATQNSFIAEEYGCTGVDDEISLNKEDEIGEKICSMFSNTEPIWDSKEGGPLRVVDCLKKIRNALDQLREAPPYENLVTNYCVIDIPHPLGIELRDIPGIGHGDWRWARDVRASRCTHDRHFEMVRLLLPLISAMRFVVPILLAWCSSPDLLPVTWISSTSVNSIRSKTSSTIIPLSS